MKLGQFSRAAAGAAALLLSGLLSGTAQAQDPAAPPVADRIVVSAVEVSGLARVDEAAVRATAGIEAGDSVDYSTVQTAIRRLWATGDFQDVDVFLEGDPTSPQAPVTLQIVVVEQPLLTSIDFVGLENVSTSAVRDSVGLRSGVAYSPGDAARAEAVIRSMLAQKGFRVQDIGHRLQDVPDRPNEKRLVFEVNEGGRVAIADIVFEGNQVFSDDDLRSALQTQREGFLWFRPGTLDETVLREDLRARLPAHYGQYGYLDAAVVSDTLVVDETTGKARLHIEVSEGPQYRLASFDVRGNRRFPSADLRRYFDQRRATGLLGSLGIGGSQTVRGDSVFDLVAFQAATQSVQQLYSNSGYLYAQVEPVLERIPASDGRGPAVEVAWQITEGQPAYIRNVAISGNTFTHEDVIRRQIMVLPGDVYSEELLIQSYRRISSLGFFETPMPFPDIRPDPETGDVDITFNVQEKQTGSINFGTAIGGVSGVAGFLGYDQPNLFGQAKTGHLRWEFGSYSNNFEASYSDPSILDSNYSGTLSVFSRRDRFITFDEGRRRQTGAALRFGLPLPTDPMYSRLVLGYSLSRTRYEQFEEEEVSSIFSQPPGVQSTVTLGLQRSTVDHPLFPTVGTRLDLTADLNGGLLGGDGNFQKYVASGGWYVPMGTVGGNAPGSQPLRFTLGLNAEMGAIVGDASRFPFDQFWMGGVQFGRSLRGYDETEITPSGFVDRDVRGFPTSERIGKAFARLSAEYALRLNDNISLGLFYDAGGLWRDVGEINPLKLARGAGVGVMLVTPFGPLGLDYAYGFDKTEPGWQLHFRFGQAF